MLLIFQNTIQNRCTRVFFNDTKKMSKCAVFLHLLLFPSQPYNTIRTRNVSRTIRMKQKNETEERNESKNDEKEYLFCTRACVCAETVLYYSFHKQGILLSLFSFCANFLVSSHSTSSESRQEANERDSR